MINCHGATEWAVADEWWDRNFLDFDKHGEERGQICCTL